MLQYIGLGGPPEVSSSGEPHLFQPIFTCRQVKALSCLDVQFCSTEQVAAVEMLIQLQTLTVLMDNCLMGSSKPDVVDLLAGDAAEISEEHGTGAQEGFW